MDRTSEDFILVAERLSKQVNTDDGTLLILHDVSFAVKAGEAVAIIGASGSGKSTLLGLLAGLDTPSSGRIMLDGHELAALDEDGRALFRGKNLGFVFQSFQLLPALNALENVMLPLELAGATNIRQRATQLLQRVGLGERLEHYPRTLSGGEQQRVAIARAFVSEPKLLFADEPTGNLDTATGASIIDLLFSLNRERGTTLVLVTHDAALGSRCNRRLEISAGRLVGDHRQIPSS
jgi:putative ABC transport system ATP-binding protein